MLSACSWRETVVMYQVPSTYQVRFTCIVTSSTTDDSNNISYKKTIFESDKKMMIDNEESVEKRWESKLYVSHPLSVYYDKLWTPDKNCLLLLYDTAAVIYYYRVGPSASASWSPYSLNLLFIDFIHYKFVYNNQHKT